MNRRRIIGIAALAALVIAALATNGFGLIGRHGGPMKLYGNVDIREVDMAFRVGGRIGAIAVDEGDKVSAGQPLAVLDTASIDAKLHQTDASVAQAEADLAKLKNGNRPQDIAQGAARVSSAEASLREAEQDVARRRDLVGPGAISNDLWQQTLATRDKARAALAEARQAYALLRIGPRKEDIAAAEASLRAAKANQASASTDRGDTRLVAAEAGTVETRAREPGAIVAAGETVLTIAIDRPMRVRAYVSESDLARISPGMAVEVTADGNPKTYHGTIGSISPQAEFTPKTVETENLRTDLVYRLRIIVTDPDDALRQGQPVTVAVLGARAAKD